jgi:rSAM/selenodomain-associated transferase 2
MNLSIIVPVFNEAEAINRLLLQLMVLAEQGIEVLLVDGGSADRTIALVTDFGLRIIQAPKGRAKQMNAGVLNTKGDVLLFLHADTFLPENAHSEIRNRLQLPYVWGRFDVIISGQGVMLKIIATFMNWRSRMTGIATGDQAIFVTRSALESVGGIPDQALMEDIELSKQLLKLSQPICFESKVTTSGRRWEKHGVWRTIALMWRLRFGYWCGQSPDKLAKLYR